MLNNRNITIGSFILLFAFMQVMWPIPLPVPTNQLFMILGMLIVLNKAGSGEMRINWRCAAFIGIIALSIICNDIPEFFKPWQRFLQFVFLFIAASPLFESYEVARVQRHLTIGILWACGVVSVVSFVAYVTGTGAYLTGIIQGYMGITPHPNFLGMYVMVAMVWFASLYFRSTENWERITWAGSWLACLIVILLTASRSSTACGLLGTLLVAYLRFRNNAGKLITALFVLVFAFIMALPYLLPYMETMMKKGVSADSEETDELVAATRGAIWELRFQELDESPVLGVGAYSCDINLPHAEIFYTKSTGAIEQGSSYLGMLAQLGWLGFICYLAIAVPIFIKAFKKAYVENTPYAQLMVALMVPIFVHMLVEGYAITAGAIQCVILWLVLGAASQCDKVADYPVLWENEDEPPISPEEYVEWKEEQEGV